MRALTTHLQQAIFFTVLSLALWPLTLPGLNDKSLYIVIGLGILVVCFPFYLSNIKNDIINRFLFPFFLLVVFTMFYRGIGFQVLGGGSRGGFLYLSIITPLLFIFFSQSIIINNRSLSKILVFVFTFALVFTVLQTLQSLEIIKLPGFILSLKDVAFSGQILNNIGYFRIGSLYLFTNLAFLFVLLQRRYNRITEKELIFYLIFIGIAALSGHRISIITLTGYLFFTFLFSAGSTKRNLRTIFKFALIALITYFLLIITKHHLPTVMVRAFSWLPGFADVNAQETSQWRLELWLLSVTKELPSYLWIGKGLTQTYANRINIYGYDAKYVDFIDSINYHNGPLSIMICFGVPAFIFFLISHIMTIKRIFNNRNSICFEQSNKLSVLLSSMIAAYLTNIFIFFFIYGDLTVSFIFLHTVAAIIVLGMKNLSMNFNKQIPFHHTKMPHIQLFPNSTSEITDDIHKK